MTQSMVDGDFAAARDRLHGRLIALLKKTKSAAGLPAGGFWVGDVAGERCVGDDMAAGRLNWRASHQCARSGMTALEDGNLELAQSYVWQATDLYIAALEARVRPSDMKVLDKPAERRGRPRKK